MLAFLHNRRAEGPRQGRDSDSDSDDGARPPAPSAVIVTLASDLADHAPALTRALGPGFDVRIGTSWCPLCRPR